MKQIHRTYKFRLYPNKEQETFLAQHFGCVRWIYNHFLNERREQYQQTGKSDSYNKQSATLTQLKKQEETKWLADVNSQTLQTSLKNLDTAFNRFFKGLAQFPKFKSRKSKNSFTVPQFMKLVDNKLYIPKLKTGIKTIVHREVKGNIQHCTISKTPTGKYSVSILSIEEYEPFKPVKKEIGIDLGIKEFLVTSEGEKFKNHKFTKKYERKLKTAQQHLSRKQKSSSQFEKQRLKVALIHEKITNSRLDTLHKISHKLVEENNVIYLEDLNVKGMIKNRKLSKHIADCSWGTFARQLEYKANWNDRQLIKVDRWYPSSKTCNQCGYINQALNLSVRQWTCPQCSTELDRDINAAKNILAEGKRISAGTSDYTDGEVVRPSDRQTSKKSEATHL